MAVIRERLRAALREARKERRALMVSALREALAALDAAEAVDATHAPPVEHGVIAGGVAGLGRGEVARRALSDVDEREVLARELEERRAAAAQYRHLGRPEEAASLEAQLSALSALVT